MPFLHRLNFKEGTLDILFPKTDQFEMFFMETETDIIYSEIYPIYDSDSINRMLGDDEPTNLRREGENILVQFGKCKYPFLEVDLKFVLKPLSLVKTMKLINAVRRDLLHLQSVQFSNPSGTSSASE
jgi:hypothetical protein